jgi:hypothetical protein
MRPSLRLSLALPLLVAVPGGHSAHADLYKLDGQFQCLEQPDAICHDATPMPAQRPVVKAAPAAARSERTPPTIATATIAAPVAAPAKAEAPGDPIFAIAGRIQAGRPAAGDLPALRSYAKSGHGSAIELLAWCALNGIGTRSDPVEAYLLYGAAASADVRGARQNQSVIYARELTSRQRQKVAEVENELLPPPALASYAAAPRE